MAQSVEPQIADLANGWLKQYKLKYYIEQDAPNGKKLSGSYAAFMYNNAKSSGTLWLCGNSFVLLHPITINNNFIY